MNDDTGVAGRAPTRLLWPGDLDEGGFLARHWQRAPLLMRQALPDFRTPLPADELAGLALEPDTTPRLIRRERDGRHTLEHGPFEAEMFATLGDGDWSLLVTDVEKHLPELLPWLAPFRIAPDWRLDDLMVSYAPDGGSVGAHVDEYDVFLLQASGTRRWSIDASATAGAHELVTSGELRLLADFAPTDTWELVPGDILYLPPGVPHHGIALGEDCTTWSIGFRAPSVADVVQHFAELLAERLADGLGARAADARVDRPDETPVEAFARRSPNARLRDAGAGRGSPGEIDARTIEAIGTAWREATALDRDTLIDFAGRLLTRPGIAEPLDTADPADGAGPSTTSASRVSHAPAPFSRLAWCDDGTRARLFADGESLACSRELAQRLCDPSRWPSPLPVETLDAADRVVLETLLERGLLLPDTDLPEQARPLESG